MSSIVLTCILLFSSTCHFAAFTIQVISCVHFKTNFNVLRFPSSFFFVAFPRVLMIIYSACHYGFGAFDVLKKII